MVLVDASTRWSHVCLLSTRNLAFARLLAQIIKLRAHFPDHPIKTISLDNAGEFSSKAFHDYCMSLGIEIQYPVAHTHTQNGLAESFIKHLQWIARPLLLRTKLPLSAWGHALLHAGNLIRLRPIGDHVFSPLQIVSGSQPNISHLGVFGCAVYVPIPPNQCSKMGPQRRLGIYVGFHSTSIIQYLEPLTWNLFTARFADCHFDESVFPPLGGDKPINNKWHEITWNTPSLLHLNTPTHIEIPIGDSGNAIASTSKPRLKRGRPIGSKDSFPRKRKSNKLLTLVEYSFDEITPEEPITIQSAPVELNTLQRLKETVTRVAVTDQLSPVNEEISINYMNQGEIWDRRNTLVNNAFPFQVAKGIMKNNDDQEPQTINECRNRQDWEKWKEAIQAELNCLAKREVFGPVVPTPENVKPVGYRWVFVRKRNEIMKSYDIKLALLHKVFHKDP